MSFFSRLNAVADDQPYNAHEYTPVPRIPPKIPPICERMSMHNHKPRSPINMSFSYTTLNVHGIGTIGTVTHTEEYNDRRIIHHNNPTIRSFVIDHSNNIIRGTWHRLSLHGLRLEFKEYDA